jgi:hypothetical protein
MATTAGERDPDMQRVEQEQRSALRMLSIGILALIAISMIVLGVMYEQPDATSPEAQQKASQFVMSLEATGLRVQDEEIVARIYGTTGGRACRMSDGDDQRELGLLNAQKTGEVNQRPGQLDPRIATYERTMIATYCPERLDEFEAFVDGLRLRELREAP